MKNSNKVIYLLSSFMLTLLFIACFIFTDTGNIARANEDMMSVDIFLQTEKMLGKEVEKYEYLYNIDDVEDYIYVKFHGEGYAIFTKKSFGKVSFGANCYRNVQLFRFIDSRIELNFYWESQKWGVHSSPNKV